MLCCTAAFSAWVSSRDSPALASHCLTPQLHPRSWNSHWLNTWQPLASWWFDFRALGKALHIFYCGYFFQVLWEHLRKHWDIFYSGRFENCIKIMIVKSFQWRGFMPLASTISTRGMGNLLNSFLLGYPSFEFSKWEIVFKDLIIYTKYLGRSHSDLVLTGFGDFSVWLIW